MQTDHFVVVGVFGIAAGRAGEIVVVQYGNGMRIFDHNVFDGEERKGKGAAGADVAAAFFTV